MNQAEFKTIAVIDDETINLKLLNRLLQPHYQLQTYNSGEAFLASRSSITPDIILLDILMPNQDGYEVLKEIKQIEGYEDVPVIFLTAKQDDMDHIEGMKLGAVDYIIKPFSPEILKERIRSHLDTIETKRRLQDQNDILNIEVEKRLFEFKAIQDILFTLFAQIVEKRDLETGNHIVRTQHYVQIIAQTMSQKKPYDRLLTPSMIETITKGSMFHDLGKIAIPDHILLKNGTLDQHEWEIMKKHVDYGKQVMDQAISMVELSDLSQSDKASDIIRFFKTTQEIILYHHEKYDGTGYLGGIKGQEIPVSARIMAVADVFDALISKRVYKEAWDFDDAVNEIIRQKGHHFDPDVVDAFVNSLSQIRKITEAYQDY